MACDVPRALVAVQMYVPASFLSVFVMVKV